MNKLVKYIRDALRRKAAEKKLVQGEEINSKDLKGKFEFIYLDDIPADLKKGEIYVIGEDGDYWNVVFICPCGCKDIIQLNLLPEARPCWRIINHRDYSTSISPSVNRIVNCKSHFTIKRNKLIWWGY